MKSHTSFVAQQTRLSEWTDLIRDCKNRPQGMKIDDWCQLHGITKRVIIGDSGKFVRFIWKLWSMCYIHQVLPKLIELWGMNIRTDAESKKLHATDREMTTALFLMRCV